MNNQFNEVEIVDIHETPAEIQFHMNLMDKCLRAAIRNIDEYDVIDKVIEKIRNKKENDSYR